MIALIAAAVVATATSAATPIAPASAAPMASAGATSTPPTPTLAIVSQDRVVLRNAPHDTAASQAVLWQGDTLEVRAERMGYLQVWDHRRERAGWVLASQLRETALTPQQAPELLAVLRFLRDAPGAESLGIAYTAAFLKAAPASAITAEPFDALGVMAERLARRASSAQSSEAAAAQLDVARQYGVNFASVEHDGRMTLCYDGEAFRRVIAMAGDAHQRARAALALTRSDCIAPLMPPLERQQLDRWRAEVLDSLDAPALAALTEPEKNQLLMARAGVWSAIAFQRARRAEDAAAAGRRAIDALAAVNKAELGDADNAAYNDAAMRVGASRWSADAPGSLVPKLPADKARLHVIAQAGEPGQTCVLLLDAAHDESKPLARRCTWGVAWTASAAPRADGRALALAVQPLEGWRELWVFRRDAEGWSVDALPPSEAGPGIGYLEFAGWVPGTGRMLVAREAREDTKWRHSFEVMSAETFAVERQANSIGGLGVVSKWQDAVWKSRTVSIR